MYDQGEGVPQDYARAISWYRRAALNGNKAGLYNLGDLYDRGEGVGKDSDRAARWFKKAALSGLDLAQFKLGTLYYCGEGVAQAPKKALQWICRAAEQGHAHARHFLKTTSVDFTPTGEDLYQKGKYFFDGQAMQEMDDDERALIRATRLGFVFQAFNLLPRTTVLENVMLPLLYHPNILEKDRVDKAMKAIDAVGLTDRAKYFTNQLSGGQQQRVAIARSLVTEPDIIFADEPTGNLDSASGTQVMAVLQRLNKEGHTIILVTHERRTAEHSKRILHILDGEIDSDSSKFKRVIAKEGAALK